MAEPSDFPLTFQLTLPIDLGQTMIWKSALETEAAAKKKAANLTAGDDSRKSKGVKEPALTLPAPVITFNIPQVTPFEAETSVLTPVARALQTFFLEQSITSSHQVSITNVCQELEKEVAEEQLKALYYQLLLREKEGGRVDLKTNNSSTTASTASSQNALYDDGIGHYDDIESAAASTTTCTTNDTPHAVGHHRSALDDWKQLAAASVLSSADNTSESDAPMSLPALLSALLNASLRMTQSGTSATGGTASGTSTPTLANDPPLAKLYQLACVYHTEHLIYLQKKQAAYTNLRNEQSKEMEIICQQAQQSEIDAASHPTGVKEQPQPPKPFVNRDDSDDETSPPSTNSNQSASPVSSSTLSDAISSLVQSHLHQSSLLEDEWEHRLDHWCRIQRKKFAIYVKDTWEEYVDRHERTLQAQAAHARELKAQEEVALAKKRKKIMKTDEEDEEERQAAEAAQTPKTDLTAQIKVYYSEEEMEREMNVPRTYDTEYKGPFVPPSKSERDSSSSASSKKPSPSLSSSTSSSSLTTGTHVSIPVALPITPPTPTFASAPPSLPPPFPLQSLLASKPIFLGPINSSSLIQLHLTNDPLFIASSERVGSTNMTNASGPNANTTTTGTTTSASVSSVPVSSSPLISFPYFVSNINSLFGQYGSGGLSAMILPHHISPLLHARHVNPYANSFDYDVDSLDFDSTEFDAIQTKLAASPLYFTASKRLREQALHYFNISNLYVKNWLQYSRNQNDLMGEEFGVQMEKIERKLKAYQQHPTTKSSSATTATDSSTSSSTFRRSSFDSPNSNDDESFTSTLLAHGDVIVTKHAHVLNAQLCFHVNVQPRRGGTTTTNPQLHTTGGQEQPMMTAGGVRMNEEEIKQQQRLFNEVLPHLISLTSRYNIQTLSLPIIWDNVLLSMWTISGSYVGFGWKEVEDQAANAATASSNAPINTAANRSEELAVYECMVRYIESYLRTIKQCLSSLPPHSPLKHVVFYLPPAATQNTLLYHLDQTNTRVSNLIGEELDSHTSGLSTHPSSTGSSHPFLGKCKLLFRDIFQ